MTGYPHSWTSRQEDLTPETFEKLLEWLDRDRNRAGEKYEYIRMRLIKRFASRGCTEPEELADETLTRVAHKLKQISGAYIGNPASYCLGVANKIFLEYLRS